MRNSGSTAYWVFIGLALVALGIGLTSYFRERAFLAHAEVATGIITEYELNVRNDGLSEYCPRIEFTTSAGEFMAVRGNICPNEPDESKIGQSAQVYYDPDDPSHYEEKTAFTGYDVLIFSVIGAVFFGLLGGIPLIMRRARGAGAAGGGNARVTPQMARDAENYRARRRQKEYEERQREQDE